MDRKKFIRNSALLAFGATTASFTQANKVQHTDAPELVVNAGISGNNTNNLLSRVDTDCLAHKPTLTIMMIGTNDMNNGKFVPPVKFRENLVKLSAKITGSGSKLLLMTILPFYEPYLLTRHPAAFFDPEGPAGKRTALNAVVRSVAEEQKLSFFDIGILFEKVGKIGLDKDCLLRNELNSGSTDGVHPTPNGYRFLALAVSQFIQASNLPLSRIVCFGDSITRGDGSVDRESYPAYLKKLLQ
jgi:lysophospholipase L1-like esterase